MARKLTLCLSLTLVLFALLLASGAPATAANSTSSGSSSDNRWYACIGTRRLSFRAGAYSGSIRGYLSPACPQQFIVVRAVAGQRMAARLYSAGPARGEITFPGGGGAGQPTGTAGIFFSGTLPSSGDNVIRVSESPMAQYWYGYYTLVVTIV